MWSYGSTGAVPFLSMVAVLTLWFGISVPLVRGVDQCVSLYNSVCVILYDSYSEWVWLMICSALFATTTISFA